MVSSCKNLDLKKRKVSLAHSPAKIDDMKVWPFLKWAGGKRWFVSKLSHLFPKNFNNYVEPFLGSGAVFFHLTPSKSKLGDKNGALIETYKAIRDDWRGVWRKLQEHQRCHCKKYYYFVRHQSLRTPTTRAARFIYLNRTCWNGLYRVNKQGKFNVPKGTKSTVTFPTDNFETLSKLFKNCSFRAGDYAHLINNAKEGDLLYVDPPYTVKHNNNNFLKYNEVIFNWEDQVRLANLLREARQRGVQILISNANHRSIRDLYRDYERILPVSRHSILAADSNNRKKTTELIITNIQN